MTTQLSNREQLKVEVRKAAAADIGELTKVLARSFDDDPFVNWVIRQDAKRDVRFERFFSLVLRKLSGNLSESFTTAELAGAAIWRAPNEWRTPLIQTLPLVPSFAAATGWSGLRRVLFALDLMEKKHEHHMPEEHYYLAVLGVDQHQQGRGIGGQLMQPILARCDAEGKPAYLETAKERNLPFYERYGFRVVETVDLPDGPRGWLMRREAQ